MMPEGLLRVSASRRAFVIDDEDGICRFLTAALATFDIEAVSFPSAETAIAALSSGHPDFIFLDIALSGSDAIEVIRTLGESGYRGVVQVMSGSDVTLLEDVKRVGIRHGLQMLSPLRKPMRLDTIRRTVTGALAESVPAVQQERIPQPPVASGIRVDLDQALGENWLELWYQPKIDLHTKGIGGVEGLIRCRHPQYGILPPAACLPGAPDESLCALTEFVVVSALQDSAQFAEAGTPLKIAVNTHIGALARTQLFSLIRSHQPKTAGWPGLLLEVTEDDVVNDVEAVHEIATQLRIYGVTLAIDDFGEGHSSFARLRELPFSELKLDRSFVNMCADNPTNAGICKAVIELAHHFGVTAVAEGIERKADLEAVARFGCDVGQGYYLARPMPKPDLIAMVMARGGQPWFA